MIFIGTQILVTSKEVKPDGKVFQIFQTVIRRVEAQNKEEALGKFIFAIQNLEAVERLSPSCDLEETIELIK